MTSFLPSPVRRLLQTGCTDRSRPQRYALLIVAVLIGAAVAGCGDVRGYEVVDHADTPSATMAVAQEPAARDTVPAIVRTVSRPPYTCARLIGGAEASVRRDTLVVRQNADERRAPFCVPYNLPVRTEGVDATARVYPADPHGDEPGYAGWRRPPV